MTFTCSHCNKTTATARRSEQKCKRGTFLHFHCEHCGGRLCVKTADQFNNPYTVPVLVQHPEKQQLVFGVPLFTFER